LNMHLQTRGGVPTHRIEGDSAILGYAIYQRGMVGTAQVNDLVMAYEFNILRTLCGKRWFPREVAFSHAKPADIRPYHRFFHAPLRFDADHSEIRFDKGWLDNPLPGHDADFHSHLKRALATQLMLEPDDYAEQVQRALRVAIPSGGGSEPAIAELMSLPVRTLRWRLARQGTSFKKLMEQVRYEIARQLLSDTQMNTAEIAEALCYADASSFTRAFRRWTDTPPATWRANSRSAEARLRVVGQATGKLSNAPANR
jgi:AraC-like DNA-binding protein